MPLVLICGLPSTGKSKRAQELKTYLENECSAVVHLISENDILKNRNIPKNKFFSDSQKEKEIRGVLKSETLRILGKDNVVILDAGNYIKGYRYELYCATKNYKTTQLTLECVVEKEKAWDWNETRPEDDKYTREVFDALHLRFEPPDSRNRWDSPLMCVLDTDELKTEDIKGALFHRKPPPPNQSTQSTPLSASEYLYELDKITRNMANAIIEAQNSNRAPDVPIRLPMYSDCVFTNLPDNITPVQMAKIRRQFLNYTKLHPPSSQAADPGKMASLFAQFVNSTLNGMD